jgi:hypothetical protein
MVYKVVGFENIEDTLIAYMKNGIDDMRRAVKTFNISYAWNDMIPTTNVVKVFSLRIALNMATVELPRIAQSFVDGIINECININTHVFYSIKCRQQFDEMRDITFTAYVWPMPLQLNYKYTSCKYCGNSRVVWKQDPETAKWALWEVEDDMFTNVHTCTAYQNRTREQRTPLTPKGMVDAVDRSITENLQGDELRYTQESITAITKARRTAEINKLITPSQVGKEMLDLFIDSQLNPAISQLAKGMDNQSAQAIRTRADDKMGYDDWKRYSDKVEYIQREINKSLLDPSFSPGKPQKPSPVKAKVSVDIVIKAKRKFNFDEE